MKPIYWVIGGIGLVVVIAVGSASFDAGYGQGYDKGFADNQALIPCEPETFTKEQVGTDYEELIQGFLENVQTANITFQLDSRNETAFLSIYLEYEVE